MTFDVEVLLRGTSEVVVETVTYDGPEPAGWTDADVRELPGIGKDLTAKIRELIDTGFRKKTGQLEDSARLGKIRKDIARSRTAQRDGLSGAGSPTTSASAFSIFKICCSITSMLVPEAART